MTEIHPYTKYRLDYEAILERTVEVCQDGASRQLTVTEVFKMVLVDRASPPTLKERLLGFEVSKAGNTLSITGELYLVAIVRVWIELWFEDVAIPWCDWYLAQKYTICDFGSSDYYSCFIVDGFKIVRQDVTLINPPENILLLPKDPGFEYSSHSKTFARAGVRAAYRNFYENTEAGKFLAIVKQIEIEDGDAGETIWGNDVASDVFILNGLHAVARQLDSIRILLLVLTCLVGLSLVLSRFI